MATKLSPMRLIRGETKPRDGPLPSADSKSRLPPAASLMSSPSANFGAFLEVEGLL